MGRRDKPEVSLIVARNDLEAVWLAALARRADLHVIALDELNWGDPVLLDGLRLSGLADTVLIAELPSPAFERRLRDRGIQVHILDHHVSTTSDGALLDRRAPLSTLEQALLLMPRLGTRNSTRTLGHSGVSALVAANDRAFIPGLAAAAGVIAQGDDTDAVGWIQAIRLLELSMRFDAPPEAVECGLDALANMGATRGNAAPTVIRRWLGGAMEPLEAALDRAASYLAKARADKRLAAARPQHGADNDKIWIVHAPDTMGPVLLDVLYGHLCRGDFRRMTVTHEVVVLLHTPNRPQTISRVEFSGRSRRRQLIEDLMTEVAKFLPAGALQYCGGGCQTCFYGAVFPSIPGADAVVDRLLRKLQIDERPITGLRPTSCK